MSDFFSRIDLLIGSENVKKIQSKGVVIFGLGGVGGFVAESLARSGIGKILLVDADVVDESNINRQIIALNSTIKSSKVALFQKRIQDINKSAEVSSLTLFIDKANINKIDFTGYDYFVDAVDTVSAKIAIIQKAKDLNIKVISSMGTANKLNPSELRIDDINKTSMCPLAKVMRKLLKDENIENVPVVYSLEKPVKEAYIAKNGKHFCGSMIFVPASAGLLMGSWVIDDIIENK